MNRILFLGFPVLVAIDTAAQVCVKLAGNRISEFQPDIFWFLRAIHEPLLYLVLLFMAGSFGVYMLLLKHFPIGPVYAAAHTNIVTVLIVSVLYFRETLDWLQVIGAVFILAGVAVLAVTEKGDDKSASSESSE